MGGIGIGILLFVVGAVLYWAWNGNIPGFNDNMLGLILMVAGVASIVLGLILNAQRSHRRTDVRYTDTQGNTSRESRRDIN